MFIYENMFCVYIDVCAYNSRIVHKAKHRRNFIVILLIYVSVSLSKYVYISFFVCFFSVSFSICCFKHTLNFCCLSLIILVHIHKLPLSVIKFFSACIIYLFLSFSARLNIMLSPHLYIVNISL